MAILVNRFNCLLRKVKLVNQNFVFKNSKGEVDLTTSPLLRLFVRIESNNLVDTISVLFHYSRINVNLFLWNWTNQLGVVYFKTFRFHYFYSATSAD